MKRLLSLVKPSIPPVALLLEPPYGMAIRVDKPGQAAAEIFSYEGELFRAPGEIVSAGEFERFAEAVLPRLGNPKRISVVLSDSFFKSQVLDISDFPRRDSERIQVLKWHVRRSLDFPVDAARIRYSVLRRSPSSTQLWVTVGREDELSTIEAVFRARGCQTGYIGLSTLELFNLAAGRDMLSESGTTLLLNRAGSTLTFLFTEQGLPLFYRSKELPQEAEGESQSERISQEIRLTLAYFRERFAGVPLRRLLIRCASELEPLQMEEMLTDEEVLFMDHVLREPGPPRGRTASLLPMFGLLEGY